jgi:hypothetical protein
VICAAIRAQGVWRRLLKGNSVGFVSQLLQVAHQSLQACDIAPVGVEHTPRTRVEHRRVDRRTVAIVLSGAIRRATLLSAGH